jgi:hypothetical protein
MFTHTKSIAGLSPNQNARSSSTVGSATVAIAAEVIAAFSGAQWLVVRHAAALVARGLPHWAAGSLLA